MSSVALEFFCNSSERERSSCSGSKDDDKTIMSFRETLWETEEMRCLTQYGCVLHAIRCCKINANAQGFDRIE